jgi:hypothetical protein
MDSAHSAQALRAQLPALATVWGWGPFALVALASGVSLVLLYTTDPLPYEPSAGVSVLALLYVFAQSIERLLVPVAKGVDLRVPKANKSGTRQNLQKTVWLWSLATLLALLACAWFGVLLLTAMGVQDVPRWFDLLITGLVIGAGTKPLHDLISMLKN